MRTMIERDEAGFDSELHDRVKELPPLRPGTAYRERVRRQFTGSVPFEVVGASAPPRRALRRWWPPLAAAALLAVALAALTARPGAAPVWRVLDVSGARVITIDGAGRPAGGTGGLLLASGSRVTGSSEGDLTVGIPGGLSLVLGPGAEVRLGVKRGVFRPPVLTAEVLAGTAWGTTGDRFPPGGLDIVTAEADAHVSGTTFAIMCEPTNTCVCVLEGKVRVIVPSGGIETVPAERRLYVSRTENRTALEPLPADERAKLESVRARGSFGDAASR